jgi:hypothetical protein
VIYFSLSQPANDRLSPSPAASCTGTGESENSRMPDMIDRKRDYSGLKHHVKVHSFRIITAILAWVFIGVAFYFRPDWIKWRLRSATHGIEAVGDALPTPWGDRIEIIFKGTSNNDDFVVRYPATVA